MSKYEYTEGKGFHAVVRSTDEIILWVGTAEPGIPITREAFKELEKDPTKFDDKKHVIKENQNVNKNE